MDSCRYASVQCHNEHAACIQNRVGSPLRSRFDVTGYPSLAVQYRSKQYATPPQPFTNGYTTTTTRSYTTQPRTNYTTTPQPQYVTVETSPRTVPHRSQQQHGSPTQYQQTPQPQQQQQQQPAAVETPKWTVAKTTGRTSEYDIHPVFTERWSPRSFIPKEMKEETLLTVFDAARWAPSAFNKQPWRFVYSMRQSPEWSKWLDVLVPQNSVWAQHASALILVTADKSIANHTFETGMAVANLYSQATFMGLATHPIAGFDHEKARSVAKVPDTHDIVCMIVIGFKGEAERLPKELQGYEKPNSRNAVTETANATVFQTIDKQAATRN